MFYHVISCYIYHKTAFSWNHSLATAVCDAGGRGLRDALTLSGRGWAMEKNMGKTLWIYRRDLPKKGNAWWQDDNKHQKPKNIEQT